MPDRDDSLPVESRTVIGEVIGNTVLAFLLTYAATRVGMALGLRVRVILMSDIAVFFFVIHADPMGMLRARPSLRDIGAKLAIGLGLAAAVALIVPEVMGLGPEPVAGVSAAAVSLVTKLWPILLLTPLLLLAPFMQGTPMGRAGPRGAPAVPAFGPPVAPLLQLGLMLLITAVLWRIGMPLARALGLAGLGLALAALETWAARYARPVRPSSAWAMLRSALPTMLASALFIGSTAYVAAKIVKPVLDAPGMFEAAPEEVLMPLLIGGGAVLGLVLAMSALAIVMLGTIALTFGRAAGAGPLTLFDLLRQGSTRLFAVGDATRRPGD